MVDYRDEPGTIRPDGTRVPPRGTTNTTIENRNGMSGTGWAVTAVIVLVVLAFVAWAYSNSGNAVMDEPVTAPAGEATPDAAPLDTAPAVDDTVAPLAPADDVAPTDAAPLDAAPTDVAPTDAFPADDATGDAAPAEPATNP